MPAAMPLRVVVRVVTVVDFFVTVGGELGRIAVVLVLMFRGPFISVVVMRVLRHVMLAGFVAVIVGSRMMRAVVAMHSLAVRRYVLLWRPIVLVFAPAPRVVRPIVVRFVVMFPVPGFPRHDNSLLESDLEGIVVKIGKREKSEFLDRLGRIKN